MMRRYFFAVGEAAALLAAAGDELAAGEVVAAAGELAGLAASEDAGLKPRLLGLFIICEARLFTTFPSDIATFSNASLRISLRWLVSVVAMRWRTGSPSG